MINRENWRNRSLLFIAAIVCGYVALNVRARGGTQYTTWYGQPSSVHLVLAVALIFVLATLFFPDPKFDPKSLRKPSRFPKLQALVKRLRRPID